jgi:hypothetical protein
VEYVRVLHLAACTAEHTVEAALAALLERGEAFDYAAVKVLAQPAEPRVPQLHIGVPDLRRYDALLNHRARFSNNITPPADLLPEG